MIKQIFVFYLTIETCNKG